MRSFIKPGFIVLSLAFFAALMAPSMALAATSPTLGTVGSYSVLGHTTVTNTGATTMPGDLGISIGGSPVGFPPGSVGPPGTIRNAADSLAAQTADTAAFGFIDQPCTTTYVGTKDLVTENLVPGVYCADSFHLTGRLTLNGDSSGVWIFKSASDLITSTGNETPASVVGGNPCNVWWRVVSSATIGTGTTFVGNILASTSISLQTGASLDGRALAQTGQVSLDTNTITGAACLSTSTSSQSPGVVLGATTGTPGLPNTGFSPKHNSAWGWIIAVITLGATESIYLIRKKAKNI